MKPHVKPYRCRKCGGTDYIIQGVNRKSGRPHRRCAICWPIYLKNWKMRNYDHVLRKERERKAKRWANINAANAAYGALHPEYWAEHSKKRWEKIKAGSLTSRETLGIVARDLEKCIYCGVRVETRTTPSRLKGFDHLIGLLDGGEHEAWNLAVCCLDCNADKGRTPFKEYIDRCELPYEWFTDISERVWNHD